VEIQSPLGDALTLESFDRQKLFTLGCFIFAETLLGIFNYSFLFIKYKYPKFLLDYYHGHVQLMCPALIYKIIIKPNGP
jgi:hypothetical protein